MTGNRRKTAILLAALLFAIGLLPAAPAAADTKTWTAGTGQWDASGNWSSSGQPHAGDDV